MIHHTYPAKQPVHFQATTIKASKQEANEQATLSNGDKTKLETHQKYKRIGNRHIG